MEQQLEAATFQPIIDILKNPYGKKIVPIVGFDVLKTTDGKDYTTLLTDAICAKESINCTHVSEKDKLNYVLHKSNRPRKSIKDVAQGIDRQIDITPLEKLARIIPIRNYINATFTNHLEKAVQNTLNVNGEQGMKIMTSSFPFAAKVKKTPDDLKREFGDEVKLFEPAIYNLFGTYTTNPLDFIATDDDVLEFVREYKKYGTSLVNLNNLLNESSLLFIGCKYPDWLFRIFLTTLKSNALQIDNSADVIRTFTDGYNEDSSFFITKHGFHIFSGYDPVSFIENLYNECEAQNLVFNGGLHQGFISYASEDRAFAQSFFSQVFYKNIHCWFDFNKIRSGDGIDQSVLRGIESSKIVFILVTEKWIEAMRNKRYVNLEWEEIRRQNKRFIPVYEKQSLVNALGLDEIKRIFENTNSIVLETGKISEESIESIKSSL